MAVVAACAIAGFVADRAHAEATAMDPLLEATLQLKIQVYDHNLGDRVKQRFVIGILYTSESGASKAAAGAMRDAFVRVSESYRVKTIKPTIVMIEVDAAKLVETLRKQEVHLIYVTPGLASSIPAIAAASSQLKIPSATNVREFVVAGIGIGIGVERNKPKVVVNLKAVVAAGMDLDAEMLGLAQVLR